MRSYCLCCCCCSKCNNSSSSSSSSSASGGISIPTLRRNKSDESRCSGWGMVRVEDSTNDNGHEYNTHHKDTTTLMHHPKRNGLCIVRFGIFVDDDDDCIPTRQWRRCRCCCCGSGGGRVRIINVLSLRYICGSAI